MKKCKYIKKEGSSCSKNNYCSYPDCIQETSKLMETEQGKINEQS